MSDTNLKALCGEMSEPYPGYAPCPACFESCGFAGTWHSSWDDPYGSFYEDRTRPCPECEGTGMVECEPRTLDDLDEEAMQQVEGSK